MMTELISWGELFL